jgi:hypothetical protein
LEKGNITIDGLVDPSQVYTEFIILFDKLSDLPSWGNARDVITISKRMIRVAIENSLSSPPQESGSSITLSAQDPLACMRDTLRDLCERRNVPQNHLPFAHSHPPPPIQSPSTAAPPSINTTSTTKKTTNVTPPEQPLPEPVQEVEEETSAGRDPGVTDVVWKQLQADKAAAIEEQKQCEDAIERVQKELREAQEAQERAQREIAKASEEAQLADVRRQEIMKKLEEERLREAAARAERARKAAELKANEEEERLRRQQEAKAQEKLRCMGVCPVGYRWIKQAGGYRCAGGTHFVTDSQLGL